jgi:surfactin synthase thioesterase subunit
VAGHPVRGGHFFPEEQAGQTAEHLRRFFAQAGAEERP